MEVVNQACSKVGASVMRSNGIGTLNWVGVHNMLLARWPTWALGDGAKSIEIVWNNNRQQVEHEYLRVWGSDQTGVFPRCKALYVDVDVVECGGLSIQ